MVPLPEEHRWTSVHAHLGTTTDSLLTPHATYLALGTTPEERIQAYRTWLLCESDDAELASIRSYIAQKRALGSPRFQAMVEKALGQPAQWRENGRPTTKTV